MFNKRFPTILGLGVIVLGIFVAVYLSSKTAILTTKAGPVPEIRGLVLSNASDSGFSLSWVTDSDFPQYVVVPESSKKNFCLPEFGSNSGPCYLDERDIDTHNPGKYKTHYVNVDGLSANTKYSVKIYTSNASEIKTFKEIGGVAISTAPNVQNDISSTNVVYGNFYLKDGKTPANGALVYLKSDRSFTLSTIVKQSGSWLIPLSKLRDTSLEKYIKLNEGESFYLEAITDNETKSVIKTSVSASQPLPNINIGSAESFDFTTNNTVPSASPVPTSSVSKKSGFSVPLSLTNPSENSSIDDLPTFRGTADPGQTVNIEIHSETSLTATVKADANGNWYWTPPSNLAPGEHTAVITVIDKNGNRQTITQTFTVLANLNLLPATAGSESAILSTPTPTVAAQITPEPTLEVVPTPTIASTPITTKSNISQDVPVTASSEIFIISLTSGVVFATMGLGLLFKRKRSY